MAVTLARRIAVAMLVMALGAAPLSASIMPSCCAKAAATGGKSSCCCGHKREAAETKSCCAKKQKSCCAHNDDVASEAHQPGLKQDTSNCCCKVRPPLPAIPESQVRSELVDKSFPLHHDSYLTRTIPAAEIIVGQDAHNLQVPAGPGFQVLLCRWLV